MVGVVGPPLKEPAPPDAVQSFRYGVGLECRNPTFTIERSHEELTLGRVVLCNVGVGAVGPLAAGNVREAATPIVDGVELAHCEMIDSVKDPFGNTRVVQHDVRTWRITKVTVDHQIAALPQIGLFSHLRQSTLAVGSVELTKSGCCIVEKEIVIGPITVITCGGSCPRLTDTGCCLQ